MPLNDLTERQLLNRLVSFPTVSSESNLELIDFVEEYLDSLNIKSYRVSNEDGTKASIYTHIGPDSEGGVVLSGHTDVVPVEGQEWDTDPFVVTESDGKLFGRGTCDMKGFNALALSAIPLALQRGLKRPLQIALSYDEEVGCTGAPRLVEHMLSEGMPRAENVIVGEPTMLKVVTGHKGGFGFQMHFRGYEVHSSIMHTGVSAIMMGAKLIDWANDMNAKNAAKTPKPLSAVFDPPYTTIHIGTISGGTAHNITAKDCRFDFDFRVVPGDDTDEWRACFEKRVAELDTEMKAVHSEAGIDAVQDFGLAGLVPEENGSAERLARQLTGDNSTNVVSFMTEAGIFQENGYSVVVCGPGSIEQAHQPNEFLTVDQLQRGKIFVERLVESLTEDF